MPAVTYCPTKPPLTYWLAIEAPPTIGAARSLPPQADGCRASLDVPAAVLSTCLANVSRVQTTRLVTVRVCAPAARVPVKVWLVVVLVVATEPEVRVATVASCCQEHCASAPRKVTVSVTPTVSDRNATRAPPQPGLVTPAPLRVTPVMLEATASAPNPAAWSAAPRPEFGMVPEGMPGPANTHCFCTVRVAATGVFVTVQVIAPLETESAG